MTRMRATALLGLSLALSPPSRRLHRTCRLALSHRRPRRPRRRLSPSSSPPLGCRLHCSMPADHHHVLLVVQLALLAGAEDGATDADAASVSSIKPFGWFLESLFWMNMMVGVGAMREVKLQV